MTLPVFLRGSAECDVERIEDWYEKQRDGLGLEFRATLDDLFKMLAERPESFPVMYRENRRAVLRRFPYNVWFRAFSNRLLVLAIIHARRGPRTARQILRRGA